MRQCLAFVVLVPWLWFRVQPLEPQLVATCQALMQLFQPSFHCRELGTYITCLGDRGAKKFGQGNKEDRANMVKVEGGEGAYMQESGCAKWLCGFVQCGFVCSMRGSSSGTFENGLRYVMYNVHMQLRTGLSSGITDDV